MDTLGIEPRAFRMRSGCDTTTPCALDMFDREAFHVLAQRAQTAVAFCALRHNATTKAAAASSRMGRPTEVDFPEGPVAQWIRHRPTEPGIAGSSPAGVIADMLTTCTPKPNAPTQLRATSLRCRSLGSPTRGLRSSLFFIF